MADEKAARGAALLQKQDAAIAALERCSRVAPDEISKDLILVRDYMEILVDDNNQIREQYKTYWSWVHDLQKALPELNNVGGLLSAIDLQIQSSVQDVFRGNLPLLDPGEASTRTHADYDQLLQEHDTTTRVFKEYRKSIVSGESVEDLDTKYAKVFEEIESEHCDISPLDFSDFNARTRRYP